MMATVGVRYNYPHVYIKHVGHPEGNVVVSAPCTFLWFDGQQIIVLWSRLFYHNESKIISACMVTHGNELLGEREIGLMSDFNALDDPIDQTHGGKFNYNGRAPLLPTTRSSLTACFSCLSLDYHLYH